MTRAPGKPGRDAQPQDDPVSAEQRRQIQRDIDENLRRTYQEALAQDVPDRFHQLLAALRDKDRSP
jgi:hypothetical protein